MKKIGFTLAELIVTLSIIGVSAALITPALSDLLPDRNKIKVLSRSLPQDKSRLVRISQEMDLVVGMTGDGVNDVYFSNPTVANVPSDMTQYVVALNASVETVTVNGGFVLQYTLRGRVWNDRMYLDPICGDDILMNPNLTQNPGY